MKKVKNLAELEQLFISLQTEWKDIHYTNYYDKSEETSTQLKDSELIATAAYGTVTQTITKTLYKTGSFYSTGLKVRYQVPVTYTQDVTSYPGEPSIISNKKLISWSQGEVVQTSGEPYHRVTSYYSGVTKYNNTTLHHTGGFTSDNYIGVEIGGYEILKFSGTSSATFDLYHSI